MTQTWWLPAVENIGTEVLFIRDNQIVGLGVTRSGNPSTCHVELRDEAAKEFFKDDWGVKFWLSAGYPPKYASFKFFRSSGRYAGDDPDEPEGRCEGVTIVDKANFEHGFVRQDTFGRVPGFGSWLVKVTPPRYTYGHMVSFSFPMPAWYDDWGMTVTGERWGHSFCVMDDFGNAVPIDPFLHDFDHGPIGSPDLHQPTS